MKRFVGFEEDGRGLLMCTTTLKMSCTDVFVILGYAL